MFKYKVTDKTLFIELTCHNFDIHSSMDIREAFYFALGRDERIVHLDMRKVNNIDSTGVATLIVFLPRFLSEGKRVKFTNVNPSIRRYLRLMQLDL